MKTKYHQKKKIAKLKLLNMQRNATFYPKSDTHPMHRPPFGELVTIKRQRQPKNVTTTTKRFESGKMGQGQPKMCDFFFQVLIREGKKTARKLTTLSK